VAVAASSVEAGAAVTVAVAAAETAVAASSEVSAGGANVGLGLVLERPGLNLGQPDGLVGVLWAMRSGGDRAFAILDARGVGAAMMGA
jgi:hypothetical protein